MYKTPGFFPDVLSFSKLFQVESEPFNQHDFVRSEWSKFSSRAFSFVDLNSETYLAPTICYPQNTMLVLVDRKTDGFQDEISPDIKK